MFQFQSTACTDSKVIRDLASLRKLDRAENFLFVFAITATFVLGMSHSEASRALDQPLGTLKTRVRSGLATLRQALTPLGGELQ